MSVMPDPFIGQVIGGCEVLSPLGRGGMSTIYLAHQRSVNREVALKVLSGSLLGDPTFMDRFGREVETTARLQHPHIVPVYDFGETGGQPYIIMAYLPGGSLADLVSYGHIELDTTARLVRQVAQALDFAHGHGVIHRDIKPANILLDSQQNAILTDFGVAHVIAATQQITKDSIVGTPSYIAPEMLADRDHVGTSVDIYSLGITLYQMLTGKLPFVGDTAMQLLWSHVNDPVPLVAPVHTELPVKIDAIIQKALAKAPDARYESSLDLAEDLESVLSGGRPAVAEAEPPPALPTRKSERPDPAEVAMRKVVLRAMEQVVKVMRPDGITGSGMYLEGGQIITCNHVIEGGQGIYVRFNTGEQIEADVLAADTGIDLALLALRHMPATLTDDQLNGILIAGELTLDPGDDLVAIGHPLGLDWSVTGGHYNALRQPGEEPLSRFGINLACPMVQVDVAINAGNSGGPIIDVLGRLVGIADSVVNPAVANNIGFAISTATALAFWNLNRYNEGPLAPYSCGHHHARKLAYCPLTGKPVKPLDVIPMPSEEGVRYSCGHVHPVGLKYCPMIGKPAWELDELPAPPPGATGAAEPAAEVKCTNCGSTYSSKLSTCPHCGKRRR